MNASPSRDPIDLALVALEQALGMIGDANDALDHGYDQSAHVIQREAAEKIRAAWASAPEGLALVMPELAERLAAGDLARISWAMDQDRVRLELARRATLTASR